MGDHRRDALGQSQRAVHVEVFQQDHELVTAKAGDGIRWPNTCVDALRDHAEEFVAGGVAQGVVDGFEVVEVAEEHRGRRSTSDASGQRMHRAVMEERSVRQTGERVVERLMGELGFEFGSFAHVAPGPHRFLRGVIEQRTSPFEPGHGAVGPEQ